MLAGLETASGGVVRIGGADVSAVPTNRRDIGMVFQAYSLFPHLTVLDNTTFALAAPVGDGEELVTRLRGNRVGKAVPLTVIRAASAVDVTVTIGERPTRQGS